jgi:nucleotide-binding universal stress UspA family protein
MGTIVIGVDGSPGSDAALRWALDEARLRNATVRVVHAYEAPQLSAAEAGVGLGAPAAHAVFSPNEVEQFQASAEKEAHGVIERSLSRVAGDSDDGPKIERSARLGSPAQALIEEGREAELLVLGSRGRGGFLGLLLGSVSQQLAHHPPCPLVILPPSEEPG